MPDHLGDDMRKVKLDNKETEPEIEGNYYCVWMRLQKYITNLFS